MKLHFDLRADTLARARTQLGWPHGFKPALTAAISRSRRRASKLDGRGVVLLGGGAVGVYVDLPNGLDVPGADPLPQTLSQVVAVATDAANVLALYVDGIEVGRQTKLGLVETLA